MLFRSSASSVSLPLTYLWSNNLGNGTSARTPILRSDTTYTLTVTDNLGCKSSANVPITVYSLPNVSMTAQPSAICDSATTRLTVNVNGGSGVYTAYVWNPNINATTSYTTPPLRTTTSYTVTVTDSRSCLGIANVSVNVNLIPTAKAGLNDTLTCTKPTIQLNGTITANNAAAVAVQWQRRVVNSTTVISNNASVPNINQAGTYIFIAQNTQTGCMSRDSLLVSEDIARPILTISRIDAARCSYTADGDRKSVV